MLGKVNIKTAANKITVSGYYGERRGINMNRKRFLFGMIMLCLTFVLGLGLSGNATTAKALTQKQAKSKIATLEKDIKKLKKQKKTALATEAKQKKGATPVYGEVICFNPFILRGVSLGNPVYYWITNSDNLSRFLTTASGYVKLTGKYKKYEGYTCAVGKAVKVSNKSNTIQKKIDKKTESLGVYKNALKEKVVFTEKSTSITVGSKKTLKWYWEYSGKYNTKKWKSSNTKVATVNSSGKVTAKKEGTATISVTTSLSKKTTKCRITVKKEEQKTDDIDKDDTSGENDQNGLKIYRCSSSDDDSKEEIEEEAFFFMQEGEQIWLAITYNGEQIDDIENVTIDYVSDSVSETPLQGSYEGNTIRLSALDSGNCYVKVSYNGIESYFGIIIL